MKPYIIDAIDIMAVLYNYLSSGYHMIDVKLLEEYKRIIEKKFEKNGESLIVHPVRYFDDSQTAVYVLNDSKGNRFAVLRPRFFIHEGQRRMELLQGLWEDYLKYQEKNLIMTSLDEDVLDIIDVSNRDKIDEFLTAMGLFGQLEETEIIELHPKNKSNL